MAAATVDLSSTVRLPVDEGGAAQRERPQLPAFNFSFACGGWLQYYLFGVARCMQDHGFNRVSKRGPNKQIFAGCSAGGLTAAAMALNGTLDLAVEKSKTKMIPLCHATWMGPFRVTEYLTYLIPKVVDLSLAPTLDGQLEMSVTKLPYFRGERLSRFDNEDHLLKGLLSTSAAVPLCRPVKMKGEWYVDGGFTEFFPRLDGRNKNETVYVSPLYFSDADIRPSRYVPLWWALLPPSCPNTIDWLFDLGYKDALDWIDRKGLADIACRHRPENDGTGSDACALPQSPKQGESICDGGSLGGSWGREVPGGPAAADGGSSGGSRGVLGCRRRPPRAMHPYDYPDSHNAPFQRLVGYGEGNRMLDQILIVGIPLFIKPLVIGLMFSELFAGMVVTLLKAAGREAVPALPVLLLGFVLLFPHLAAMLALLAFAMAGKFAVMGCHSRQEWRRLRAYVEQFALAIVLVVRSLPGVGKYVQVDDRQGLLRHSAIYRMALHFL